LKAVPKQPVSKRKSSLIQKGNAAVATEGINSMTNWLIALVMILPFLYSTQTMDPVLSIRYVFLSGFVLLFLIYFLLFNNRYTTTIPQLVKAVFLASIGYGVWSLISAFKAINLQEALYETARHFLNTVMLFVVMITVNREPEKVMKLCKGVTLVAIAQSLIGILQFFNIAFSNILGAEGYKPIGLMANRNLFGSAQVLLLPFILTVLQSAKKSWSYIALTALFVTGFTIELSQTRSAWLATIIFTLTSLLLITLFSPANRKRWWLGTAVALSIATIVFILLLNSRYGSFAETVQTKMTTLAHPTTSNSSMLGRYYFWQKTLKLIKAHPLMGVGAGNWKLAVPAYGSENMPWADGLTLPNQPDNVYLQVASETGLPSALLYFTVWVLLAVIAFRVIKKTSSEDTRIVATLMVAGIPAFATDSCFSFPTERIEHSLYFSLFAGIIMGMYTREVKLLKIGQVWNVKRSAVIVACLLVLFNFFLATERFSFERHAHQATVAKDEGRFADVIAEAEAGKSAFVTLDPRGEPIEMQASEAYVELRNYEAALKEIKIAERYHLNSARIYTAIGIAYDDLQLYDKAINAYLKALHLAPRYDVALKDLAVAYYDSGDYSSCVETFKKVNIQQEPKLVNLLNDALKHVQK
jgi:O-antigen ligase